MRSRYSRLNEDVARDQQIGVLGHGSGQRVLDRESPACAATDHSSLNAVEDFRRPRTGHNRAARQHLLRRFVTERTKFSLDRDFHHVASYQRKSQIAA